MCLYIPALLTIKFGNMSCQVEHRADSVAGDISIGRCCNTERNAMRRLIWSDDVESEVRIAILVHLPEHTHGKHDSNTSMMCCTPMNKNEHIAWYVHECATAAHDAIP